MKKTIILFLSVVVAAACLADPLDMVKLSLPAGDRTSLATNATSVGSITSQVDTAFLYGNLEAIILDLQGYASPTVTVDIATVASNGMGTTAITLWSSEAITADEMRYIRVPTETTGGAAFTNINTRIPLIQSIVRLRAYNANVTNDMSLDAYIIYSK